MANTLDGTVFRIDSDTNSVAETIGVGNGSTASRVNLSDPAPGFPGYRP